MQDTTYRINWSHKSDGPSRVAICDLSKEEADCLLEAIPGIVKTIQEALDRTKAEAE